MEKSGEARRIFPAYQALVQSLHTNVEKYFAGLHPAQECEPGATDEHRVGSIASADF